jgi:ferric-dicitrate binding protein FerR (iron transport regulator)
MDEELVEQNRVNMELKSTDELRRILQENNKQEWSEEAFAAIRRTLEARGEPAGLQEAATNEPGDISQPRRPGCVTAAALLLGIASATAAIRAMLSVLATGDEAAVVGMIATGILAAVYLLVARGLWQLKNWARIAFIVLNVLATLLTVAVAISIPEIVPGVAIGVAITGYVIYWFAAHGKYFH